MRPTPRAVAVIGDRTHRSRQAHRVRSWIGKRARIRGRRCFVYRHRGVVRRDAWRQVVDGQCAQGYGVAAVVVGQRQGDQELIDRLAHSIAVEELTGELEILAARGAGGNRVAHRALVIAPVDLQLERVPDARVIDRSAERRFFAFVDGRRDGHVREPRHGVGDPGHARLGIGRARVVVAHGDGQEIDVHRRGGRIIVRIPVVQDEIGRAGRKRVRVDPRAIAEVDIHQERVPRTGIGDRPGNLEVASLDGRSHHAHIAEHRIDVIHRDVHAGRVRSRVVIRDRGRDRVIVG